jgi:hypothetical protein
MECETLLKFADYVFDNAIELKSICVIIKFNLIY